MDEPTFIFVGGLHRSGTTVLADWLSGYREVGALTETGVTLDEGQFLQNVFPDDNHFGGPGRFGFDPRAHMAEAPLAERSAIRELLCRSWLPYGEPGARYLVEKSPGNLLRLRYLQSVFPDARLVAIMRHPVAVAQATQKWSRTSLFSLIAHWVECHRLFFRDLRATQQTLVISYEHLISDTRAVTAQLEAFLRVDEHRQPPRLSPTHNDGYLAAWERRIGHLKGRRVEHLQPAEERRRDRRPVNRIKRPLGRLVRRVIKAYIGRSHLGLYREDLDAQDAIARFEDEVLAFGYSLVDLGRYPRSFEVGIGDPAATEHPAQKRLAVP